MPSLNTFLVKLGQENNVVPIIRLLTQNDWKTSNSSEYSHCVTTNVCIGVKIFVSYR